MKRPAHPRMLRYRLFQRESEGADVFRDELPVDIYSSDLTGPPDPEGHYVATFHSPDEAVGALAAIQSMDVWQARHYCAKHGGLWRHPTPTTHPSFA